METLPRPIGEAVVHDVADEPVLEPVAEGSVGLDEPAEPDERGLVELETLVTEEFLLDDTPEAPAEHRGVREHAFRQRVERIDLCREDALQRFGNGVEEPSS